VKPVRSNFQDITNKRYGRLLVIDYVDKAYVNKDHWWLCLCDCGNSKKVLGTNLKRGTSFSCGCLRSELLRRSKQTHGMTLTSEFNIWNGMRKRCLNKNNKDYKNYGGRGIKVCDRWLNSFENFYVDMGGRPSAKHSIDRINNDGDYEPSNCRWATAKEQQNIQTKG